MGTGIASPLWPPGIIHNVGSQYLPLPVLPAACLSGLASCLRRSVGRFFRKALTLHHQGVFNQDSFTDFPPFFSQKRQSSAAGSKGARGEGGGTECVVFSAKR